MKLFDVCEINPKGQGISDDTLVSFVAMTDVSEDGKINTSVLRPFSEVKKGYTVFQEGDILFAKITPCMENGKGALAIGLKNGIGVGSTEFHVLRPNPDLVNGLWVYYLTAWPAFRHEAESHMTGSAGQRRVPKSFLGEYSLSVPSLNTQYEQVEHLNKVNKIIEARKEQLCILDQLVKARFVEMFGDNESNPKGWTQSKIGDCCTLKSGTSLPADVENEGGPIPYVKVGDMNYPGNERYITTSSRYVSTITAGNGLFAVGSILFPKRGGAIGTNKKRMTKLPICADLNIMGVSSNGALLPEYLLTYFDMIDLGALSDGSSVPQINNKNIAPLLICLPPMELQREFASFVSQVDKSKLSIQASLDQLETLKQSLMQEYFG